MKSRKLGCALIAAIVVIALDGCSSPPAESAKLIILGWDGMPAWVVDRLLEEDQLPGLARLARDGARAKSVTPGYPSVTAPGWAALWTGAYGDVTGITGNVVPVLPRSEHTLLERQSGFGAAAHLADPIWMPTLRAGRRVLVLSASGFQTAEKYHPEMQAAGIPWDRLMSYNLFGASIAGARVFDGTTLKAAEDWQGLKAAEAGARELSFTVGESMFHVLIFSDPSNPVSGFNMATICAERKALEDPSRCEYLAPAEAGTDLDHWSRPFEAKTGDLVGRVSFRLFELASDGSRMLLYQRAVSGVRNPSPEQEEFLDASGALGDDAPFFGLYTEGRLGAAIWEDGDGVAERRLLEILRLNADFAKRAIGAGLDRYAPDLLMYYTAASDSAGHVWMGVLDPRSPRFDPVIADKLWPSYVQVLRLQDDVLDDLLDRIESDTIVTVVSDHGMAGIGKGFFPNAVLEEAGLLSRHPDGTIDLGRTLIHGSWRGGFFLNVNSTDWKDGIVAQEEIEGVMDRATRALLSAVDPDSGEQIVTGVFRQGEVVNLGIGGPSGGDLYLDFAYGYYPGSGRLLDRGLASRVGFGEHGFYPLRAEMQTIWFLGGAGILPGQELPSVRQIDIAPTLAALTGIAIPGNSQGHIIGQLERIPSN